LALTAIVIVAAVLTALYRLLVLSGGLRRANRPEVSLPSLHGPDEYKLEYIKAMLELVREDIRHVLLRVTAALAVTALFITQVPYDRLIGLPLWTRVILCLGLASIALSGGLYFRYVRSLHITQMRMTRCIPTLDVYRTRALWAGPSGVWQRHKTSYRSGTLLFAASAILLGTVVFYLFLARPKLGH